MNIRLQTFPCQLIFQYSCFLYTECPISYWIISKLYIQSVPFHIGLSLSFIYRVSHIILDYTECPISYWIISKLYIQSVPYHIGLSPSFIYRVSHIILDYLQALTSKYSHNPLKTWCKTFYNSLIHFFKIIYSF